MPRLIRKLIRTACFFGLAVAAAAPAATARAQDDPGEGIDKPANPKTKAAANPFEQAQKLQEDVKNLGVNWYNEANIIREAHFLVFQQNGWTSESDQFALGLVNQVSTIEPWRTQEREAVFLDSVQRRFGLSQDQVDLLNTEMRQESIAFTMKHFNEMMPVAMEAIQARVRGEPFTPEMVQKWCTSLEPIMGEALESVKRVEQKLEGTMDESQKELLRKDMEAVYKRHNDVMAQVEEWKQGKWTPYHFGLQNDPVYAGEMYKYKVPDFIANRGEAAGPTQEELLLAVTQRDPTLWEKYVLKFVADYDCNEKQRGQALAILKESEAEATQYLAAKGEDLTYHETRAKESPSDRMKKFHAGKADQLRRPIEGMFERMCKRLENKVLDRAQRIKLAENRKAAKKGAKSSGKRTRGSGGATVPGKG